MEREGLATETHCPYCALQCGIELVREEDGIQLTPSGFPTNRGALCAGGGAAAELLDQPGRVRGPLVRAMPGDRRRRLRPVPWDEALDRVVAAVRSGQVRHGRDSVGGFGGGGLTSEKAYQLGKFARVAL